MNTTQRKKRIHTNDRKDVKERERERERAKAFTRDSSDALRVQACRETERAQSQGDHEG